jgi:structural maintenance of chromosomes protein 6
MAPRKRPGPFETDDNSSNDEDVASPSSSGSRKRRRISGSSSPLRSPSSSNADPEEVSTPASDVEMFDGSGSGREEGAESAEDEEAYATQAAERREHLDDCGVLEKVEIKNFMCHERYEFKLGPRINFICGKNGSGKSAILTAIVLCLGGKASATNRASSLKDLIKHGQESANITCHVKNVGDGAYKPEVYGKRISIERHFSKTGTTGFKMKNETGKIISTKRADLDDICDHFGFQVENPMSVLSQDLARQFITSSSPAEKYKLFVKGVLLEQLDQDYCIIEQQLQTFNPKIEDSKQDLQGLQTRAETARRKAEHMDKYEALRDKFHDMRRQLLWEAVRLEEDVLEEQVQALQQADDKIREEEGRKEQLQATVDERKEQKDAAKLEEDEANHKVNAANEEKNALKAKQADAKKEMSEARAEQRNVKGAIDGARKTIDEKKKSIQVEMDRLAEIDGGGATRRLRELEEAQAALVTARESDSSHRQAQDALKRDFAQAQTNEKQADATLLQQKQEIKKQEDRLMDIQRQNTQSLEVFHPKMSQILRAIQQERRFRTPPVGPIGKHIKLLHPEWSSILEKAFGGNLNNFIVTCKADQDLLTNIFRNVGASGLAVNFINPEPVDIQNREPDESFLTMLRALQIDHPMVRKFVIINQYAENSILMPSQTEASELLFSDEGSRPRNVSRCFCFSARNKTRGILLHFKGGRPAQDPIDAWRGHPRMQTDIADQIRNQESVINDAKSQRVDIEANIKACQNATLRAKQELQRWKNTAEELKVATQVAEDKVDKLKDEIERDNVEKGNLDILRKVLAHTEAQLEIHEGSYMDARAQYEGKKTNLSSVTKEMNNFDLQINTLIEEASRLKTAHQEADKKYHHAINEVNAAVAKVAQAEKDREQVDAGRKDIVKSIDVKTQKAREVSERVNFPENETFDSLEAKYYSLHSQLAAMQKKAGGSREELEAEKARSAQAYMDAKVGIDHMTLLSDTMHETMGGRRRRWNRFQKFISIGSKWNFSRLLLERQFRGTLILDHERRLLEIKIEPDITKTSGDGRNANTLSGGEKSFSQICLLLAIWEAMGSPIRCLDEFDVFMDAVNRTRSASILIDGARTSTGKQFILISPGTKSDIPAADDVVTLE